MELGLGLDLGLGLGLELGLGESVTCAMGTCSLGLVLLR